MSYQSDINSILKIAIEKKASDVHLVPGAPPLLRIYGEILPLNEYGSLNPTGIRILVKPMVPEEKWAVFEQAGEVDFPYGVPGLARFRCNMFKQRGSISLAMRVINSEIKSIEKLGLPEILKEIVKKRDGLILVTGPTGSGKSTTLAAMIDLINQERKDVIITLEDPIEYLHQHKNCIISQREIGSDTRSFADGLRSALRSDPDVIQVGEMRDLETISTALTAAETGHLVLSTLHTRGAAKTIDRIIDAFPSEQQQQIRIQLAAVLEAVIYQQLIKRKDGKGMVPAVEVLIGTPAVRNMIREGKTHQLNSVIETSVRFGMKTAKMALEELVKRNLIDPYDLHTQI
ncbi:MAG: type IV pilus twitching motility protein PilT [Firmicutes bacterium]|nr:type IV pilus twitching motility protein PilT [Bacillota bacterium]